MSSDLDRFLRAVRTLAKLAHKYGDDCFLDALGRYAAVKQEGEVWFVGTFLDDIGRELADRRVEPKRICAECGNDDADRLYDRSDSRYCSAKCRQKAYRKRVTGKASPRAGKRNGTRQRYSSPAEIELQSVTQDGAR
jgi:hypothetical protein